jgi:hypothetical protein
MKKIFLLWCIIAIQNISFSQNNNQELLAGNGFLTNFGLQMPQLDNLNNFLQQNNYASFNNVNSTYGFGFIFLNKQESRIFVQGDINISQAQSQNTNGNIARLSANNFNFSLGYHLYKSEKILFSGLLGFNGNTAQLILENKSLVNPVFSNNLNNATNVNFNKTFNYGGNVGLQVLYNPFPFRLQKNNEGNLVIGAKVYYALPLSQSNWNINGINLNNSPDVNMGGLFVTLQVGVLLDR